MKRVTILLVAVASAASFTVVGTATAATPGAAPGQGKITCLSDNGGVCTVNTGGAKGTVTLDTTGAPVDPAVAVQAGAYIPGFNSSFYGVRLALVKALSFTYSGVASGPDPHQSIPIDTDDDGFTDYFVFVSASTCNNGAGLVDVINDTTCTIYGDAGATYPNWKTFATTAGTNFYIALNDYFTFVFADSTPGGGVWVVGNLTVGKPGK